MSGAELIWLKREPWGHCGMSSVEDDSLEGGAETIVQVQVKDLRIDNSVHDGGVFEEDSDVDDGVADADL